MINSMTGYGSAEGQADNATYVVEIKTVNNRYYQNRIKLPDMAAFLEEDIEKLLRKNLSRGTVHYMLAIRNVSADVLFNIDEAALANYLKKLAPIAESVETKSSIDISGLLNLPGILAPVVPDREQAELMRKAVLDVTAEALEKLKKMRAVEGAALAADLNGHCELIAEGLKKIGTRKELVQKEFQKKLKARVDSLLANAKLELDQETLAREVAVFADKSDISEEIARLESHLKQFADSCAENGQAGRRLDFLSQEMLREANTIASKASDSEIIHWVVDIKCRIDRIKEQVQNAE